MKLARTTLWCAMAALAGAVPTLIAQQAGEDAQARKFYEDLIRAPIIPTRSAGDIRADLSAAEQDMQHADKAIPEAQTRVQEAERWLTTQKGESDALKAKISAAKKEKREADKISLEGQRKQLELVEEYLKRTKAIRETELDLAKAQKELAAAEMKVYQAEDDLNKKKEAIQNARPSEPNLAKIVLEGAQAGENALKLMKTMADRNNDVASRMKQLADRRIDLAEARNKLLSEDRIRAAAASMKK